MNITNKNLLLLEKNEYIKIVFNRLLVEKIIIVVVVARPCKNYINILIWIFKCMANIPSITLYDSFNKGIQTKYSNINSNYKNESSFIKF